MIQAGYWLAAEQIVKKDLGIIGGSQDKPAICLAVGKANSILGFSSRSTARKVIVFLYSVLVRQRLKYCVQILLPHARNPLSHWSTISKRATKMF